VGHTTFRLDEMSSNTCCWQTSDAAAVEIDVKRKLSEGQCSGSVFSDVTLDKSAYEEANERQLTVIQVPKQSGQVCHSSHVYLTLSEMAVESDTWF